MSMFKQQFSIWSGTERSCFYRYIYDTFIHTSGSTFDRLFEFLLLRIYANTVKGILYKFICIRDVLYQNMIISHKTISTFRLYALQIYA